MKRQNKKAFTLVELLVVIAILAILASVAVVGYTSFLKNAAVSNDESVVAQMNRYLEALRANELYGKEIHAGNIREITAHIIAQMDEDELEPEAAKYGYDFYFDLKEGVYVSMHGADINRPGVSNGLFGKNVAYAAPTDSEYEVRLENAFTQDNRYFLVSTSGELADIISAFYALGESGSIETDIVALINRAKETEELKNFVDSIVVVADKTNYKMSADASVVVIVDGIQYISASTQIYNGETFGDAQVSNQLADVNHITLPDSVTAIEDGALNLKDENSQIHSDKTAAELANIAAGSFTNGKIVNSKGDACTSEDNHIKDAAGNEVIYSYSHALKDIVIGKEGNISILDPLASNPVKKVELASSTIIIPAEAKVFTFKPDLIDFDGNTGDDVLILGAENIVWECSDTENVAVMYDVATRSLKIEFTGAARPESFTLTATTNGKIADKVFTVKVENITSGTIKLADTELTNGSTTNMTLIKSPDLTKYNITKDVFSYVHGIKTANGSPIATETINWTYTGTGLKETSGTGAIEVTGNGEGTLVINVGTATHTYLTYTVNLTIADTSSFPLQPKHNNNLTALASGTPVAISDLFEKTGDIPAGAKLVVYNGNVGVGDSYLKPARYELYATSEGMGGVSVDVPNQAITNDNYGSLALTFAGSDTVNTVRIAVVHNGVRISEDIEVLIVDAVSVKSYDELKATLDGSYNFTKSIVLMSDISMTTDVNYLTIVAGKTLYGNGFTFNITNGRKTEEGIINLKGTLRDIKIVGAVYSTFAFSAGDDYGSSAVNANGADAYIYNSYIANTRSPLRTSGANVVIEDSVLFGGRYSNIDMTGGTINIRGNVTTIQQVYSNNNVIGMGVSAWFNDGKKNVNIEDEANFIQYNFMDSSISQYLPKLNLKGIYDIMDLKEPFNAMFKDTATYGQYMYTASNGTKYVNSGIISTDKYMLDYEVTGSPSSSNWLTGKKYDVGAIKTVKVVTAVGDDEKLIVAYDTRFTPKVGTVISAGYVEVTGAQLKAGVQFEVNTQLKFGTVEGDGTSYMFQIQSDDYLTINVLGSSINEYNSLSYRFSKDLSNTLGLAESILSMHDRGIHFGKMNVGVNTPKSSAIAVGTTTYQQLLEQYIEMTDGDGTDDNFYAPENFQFVNGHVTNYWDK